MEKKIRILFIVLFILAGYSLYANESYKKLEDHMGNIVKMRCNPKRIITLNSSMMEGLYEIGMEPIAKVDEYKIRQKGINLPSIGSKQNINIEAIYRLNPDLIIANARNHGNIQRLLKETGAAVYMYNPSKLGERPFYDIAIFLAKLFDCEEKSTEYVQKLNLLSEKYKKRIYMQKSIKTGLIIENIDNLTVYQKDTAYGTIMDSLGIKNIVPDNMLGNSKDAAINFSIENIYISNPDIILITAHSNKEKSNTKVIENIKKDSIWKNLKAVRNNNIKILPFKAHPGRVKKDDFIKIMAETILSN